MNSKQLRHTFSFRIMLSILVTMFVVIQPVFADDERDSTSWWDRFTSYFGDGDRDRHYDRDRDRDHDDDHDHEPPSPPPGVQADNYIAIHDRNSPQYDDNCTSCHAEIHTRQTLDPSIPDAHVAMLPAAPGENDNDNKCKWCHRSVDLVQAAGSPQEHINSLRKHVDSRLCTLCHGPGGNGKQFYRVGMSALNLSGAEMYGLVCSGCHGGLANSEVRGEDATEINEAIAENEGGMSPLQVLTPAQIQAIATALN